MSAPRTPLHEDWPLAGRDAEVGLVVRALRSGRGVVIAGATGVGKTRLAREAVSVFALETDGAAEVGSSDKTELSVAPRPAGDEPGCVVETILATRASASIPLGSLRSRR